jgi:SIR2-like domain
MTETITIDAADEPAAKYLEPFLQSGNLNFLIGSGASAPAIKTAGDIESVINSLLAEDKEDDANKKSLEFIATIAAANSKILSTALSLSSNNFRKVTKRYTEFLTSVDRILFARKNILLPRQANIFTTNYDIFIEHAASLLPGTVLNDGFDRSSPIKAAAFAPERYFDRTYRSGTFYNHQIEIPTLNLIKLHGSLTWRKKLNAIVFDPSAIPSLPPGHEDDPAKVRSYLSKHFIILPNLKKFHATLMERTYYDLLRLFSRALDQQNVVLISFGFSFADEHILDLTRRALRNPTSHLIILAYDHTSAEEYQTKFAQQRNVTVIAPDPASVLDFPRLNKILSSILPVNTNAFA